jgi:ABC-type branched-subunit amino acid transport system substrate-binding protein
MRIIRPILWIKQFKRRFAGAAQQFRPHRQPFAITFMTVLLSLLVANLFTQIAIQEDWALFIVIIVTILGLITLWIQRKSRISRHFKNAILGTLVSLGCVFFCIIFLYSASKGNWLEAANILLAALAALWVLFHDLVTDSTGVDETTRESHILRYSRKAIVYIFISVAILAGLSAIAAAGTRPKLKVAISLPLSSSSDIRNSLPLYRAYRQACANQAKHGCGNLKSAGKGYDIELVLLDDSRIAAGEDCTQKDSCELRVIPTKQLNEIIDTTPDETRLYQKVEAFLEHQKKTQTFQGFMNTPNIVAVLGPFNSGVAIREIPALSQLSIPLISASATADCLTNPKFAAGDCSTGKLGDKGYFFRTITTDSIRNKLFAQYLSDAYGGSSGLSSDEVVFFEQSGPRANFFAHSFTQTFIDGLREAQGVGKEYFVQPKVILASDNMTVEEIQARVCHLPQPPKVVVYSGTGELNSTIYKALNCAALRDKPLAYAGAGSAERFLDNDIVREAHRIYTIHGAIITNEATAQSVLPDKTSSAKEYAAQSYDTATLTLQAVISATDALIQDEDPWNIRALTFNRVNLPRLLTLSAAGLHLPGTDIRMPLVIPLGVNHDVAKTLSGPLRQAIAIKVSQTNTIQDKHRPRVSLTGTYSFNDDGDADGAAGATIKLFCHNGWQKVTDSITYPSPYYNPRATACLGD